MLGVAPKVFIYTECKLSTKVHIFIWGGLRGGTSHPRRTATVGKGKTSVPATDATVAPIVNGSEDAVQTL